jgi:hypothetical protein
MMKRFPKVAGQYLSENYDYRSFEVLDQTLVTIDQKPKGEVLVHVRHVGFDRKNMPHDNEKWEITRPKRGDVVRENTFKGKIIRYFKPENAIQIQLETPEQYNRYLPFKDPPHEIFLYRKTKWFSYYMGYKTRFCKYYDLKWYTKKLEEDKILGLGEFAQELIHIMDPKFKVSLKKFMPLKWSKWKVHPRAKNHRKKTATVLGKSGYGFELTYNEEKNIILEDKKHRFSGINLKAIGLSPKIFDSKESSPVPEFRLYIDSYSRIGVEGNIPARFQAKVNQRLKRHGLKPFNDHHS